MGNRRVRLAMDEVLVDWAQRATRRFFFFQLYPSLFSLQIDVIWNGGSGTERNGMESCWMDDENGG